MNELTGSNNNSMSVQDEYKGMLQRLIEIGMNTNQEVTAVKEDLNQVKKRVDNLEFNEEITYDQQKIIDGLITKRVYQVLELGDASSRWSQSEELEYQKYGNTFRRRLRSEVANKGHLAFPFRTTEKGNYDKACRDIMAWFPRNGIDALKAEVDRRAEAKRKAMELGYE